jgi:Fic family protein
MKEMVAWLATTERKDFPCPLRAGIAHYQFATIHPYYDGNGRTARLLTTFILHLGGYDLKGLYSLEEYYARDLGAYYDALTIGPSHNYYEGRAKADLTKWVEYFCEGMAESFESVKRRAGEAASSGVQDRSPLLTERTTITSRDVARLFGISERAARNLLAAWVENGFLVITDPAKKSRKYELASEFSADVSAFK